MIVPDTATLAADWYMKRWAELRDKATDDEAAAEHAPGPLTALKLREQARRAKEASDIAYLAAWAELHAE